MDRLVLALFCVLLFSMLFLCGCEAHSQRHVVMAQLKKSVKEGAKEVTLALADQKIELVKIPDGSFLMGSEPEEKGHEPNEEPVRQITISRPFYIGRYEITQAQYFAVMGHEPLSYLGFHQITSGQYISAQFTGYEIEDSDYFPIRFEGDNLPVDEATYRLALKFCHELSKQIGMPVTLPTSAQWEYACRAGTTTRFYTGDTDEDLSKAGWFRDNSNGRVHPVGQKEPNAFGLYDMLGNVYEYSLDYLPSNEKIEEIDPIGKMWGSTRGGAWLDYGEFCRAAFRALPEDIVSGGGIRIVINPDSITKDRNLQNDIDEKLKSK